MTTTESPIARTARTLLAELPSARLQLTLAAAVIVLLLLFHAGFRVQASGSGPRGIWHFKQAEVERSAWVAICPDPLVAALATQRGYAPGGPCAGDIAPLLKQVVALPGDTVEIGPAGIAVNGALVPETAVRPADRHGRPLPHPDWGVYPVEAGTLWVANARADSFDSRYFGPIDAMRVLSVADAVLVEGEAP